MPKDMSPLPTRFEAHRLDLDQTDGLAILLVESDQGPLLVRMKKEVLQDFYGRAKHVLERLA